MIIVIVGLPLAGKTTALDVAKELGFKIFETGEIVREEVKRRGLPYTPETDRDVSGIYHNQGREEEIIKKLLEGKKLDFKKDKIVIEGLRSLKQLRYLEELTGQRAYIISIVADLKVRVERARKRKRFGSLMEDVASRDKIETERGLKDIMMVADEIIDTTKMSMESAKEAFREALKSHFQPI